MEKIDLEEIMPLRDSIIAKIEIKESKQILKAVKIGPEVKYVQEGDILLVSTYEFMNTLDDEHYIISELVVTAVKRLK